MTARRLFVALDPDDAVRRGIAATVEGLRRAVGPAGHALRFADPASFHLTLRFLGDVAEERLPDLTAAVAGTAAAGRPLALQVRGAGAFPGPGRPRTVWLGLAGELAPLQALAASLDLRLGPLGFPAEARTFTPHLTVARARGRGAVPGLAAALEAVSTALAPMAWLASTLTLFESHLEPGGARHLPLLRAPLGAPQAPAPPRR